MHNCLHIQWSDSNRGTLEPQDFITINVSGGKYETLKTTLERFPNTLLGNEATRSQYFVPSKNAYFFNRCRQSFDAILHYYQTNGVLVRPQSIPMDVFENEVTFFALGEDVLHQLYVEEGLTTEERECDVPMSSSPWQRHVWKLFEYPDSSRPARVVSSISMFVIGLSIFIFCLETLPQFKEEIHAQHIRDLALVNGTHNDADYKGDAQPWFALELGCCTWFALEYVMRLYGSPSKLAFFKSFANAVDFLAIAPYFIVLACNAGGGATPLSVLRVVRLIRVFRIFKLSRHSMNLKILGNTLHASMRELGMLAFFLCIGVLVFSSGMYYAEYGTTDTFPTIPDAFWYSLVTMTTVGYGDVTPSTRMGKLIGSMCAITGVLTLALPVPVIVSNFEFFYKRDQLSKAAMKKNEEKAKK